MLCHAGKLCIWELAHSVLTLEGTIQPCRVVDSTNEATVSLESSRTCFCKNSSWKLDEKINRQISQTGAPSWDHVHKRGLRFLTCSCRPQEIEKINPDRGANTSDPGHQSSTVA